MKPTKRQIQIVENFIKNETKRLMKEASADKYSIEAYGVRGMKSIKWRKTFKDYKQLEIWADKMDAEIIGTRTLKNGQPLDPEENDPYMTND